MKSLHLVCNAHLDPVWMWEWEEGIAAAISTFRTAADLCEETDGFVFNHNEVILYEWVADHEPALFERIQRLVAAGKWHIMGGWFLQPDCNMPSGESFIRQMLVGRRYFEKHFGARPTTAINFDPFGHSRGLVQLLAKSGYTAYLHCRPHEELWSRPGDDYLWVGFDGSTVLAHRANTFYNAPLGKAREKVEKYIKDHADRSAGLVLWGVGNHGGGPSRQDIADLNALISEHPEVVHSTPEAYFAALDAASLPRHEDDVNAIFRGCYTSQIRIKQQHRRLENELYAVEKMRSAAALQFGLPYPHEDLAEAFRDLLTAEFHDILPGSSIPPVEEAGLRLMDHGLDIAHRLKMRAFFALSAGQKPAAPGEIPILAYNPHPYPVEGAFACEFSIADFNWNEEIESHLTLFVDGREIPCQVEQEYGNVPVDWRKRLVFHAVLPPSQMSRFDAKVEMLPRKPQSFRSIENALTFQNDRMLVSINPDTGLLERYAVDGIDLIAPGAFRPLVIRDMEDAWGDMERSFRDVEGAFELMSPEEGTAVSGLEVETIPSVRIVEDGPARTIVEALLAWNRSYLRIGYVIPKQGTEIEVQVRAHWQEARRMLKLSIPTPMKEAQYLGQTAFGVQRLPENGDEAVAQKWVAVCGNDAALSCVNDSIYGSDFVDGELRLSLLRSPAYSAMAIGGKVPTPQDRFHARLDMGVREYRFWINGGRRDDRLERIDREALAHNEPPMLVSFFPSGAGELPGPLVTLDDPVVQLTCFKAAEDGQGYIVRLLEPTGRARATRLRIPALGIDETIHLGAFEVATYRAGQTLIPATPLEE